nr:hypothetical protein [Nocardioides glacieisoli]
MVSSKRFGQDRCDSKLLQRAAFVASPGAYDDRSQTLGSVGVVAQPPHDAFAVHAGHRKVEEHDVVASRGERSDGLEAVARFVSGVSSGLDHTNHEFTKLVVSSTTKKRSCPSV